MPTSYPHWSHLDESDREWLLASRGRSRHRIQLLTGLAVAIAAGVFLAWRRR